MSLEDIEQAADQLIASAETIQLLIADIENNNDLNDVTSILNLILTKVRNLSDQLQQYRNRRSDVIGERAYSSPTASTGHGPGHPRYVMEGDQIQFFKRTAFPVEKDS